MKVLFEGYYYPIDLIKSIGLDKDDSILSLNKNNKLKVEAVGYFYSKQIDDAVFILPKVFIKEEKAFGKYLPEDLFNIASSKCNFSDSSLTDINKTIYDFSIWTYLSISRFQKDNIYNRITKDIERKNIINNNGSSNNNLLDIVISLLEFHKKNKQLFSFLIHNFRSQDTKKINWNKTVRSTTPFIKGNIPIYLDFINNHQEQNFNETLICLFYSVLNYLNERFPFHLQFDLRYSLISPIKIQNLIDSGKGISLLKSIRRKYYRDVMISLWDLLLVFFEKSTSVLNKSSTADKLLVRNFNIVFESMIDTLISDTKDEIPIGLKDQFDGKIVDHIYKDKSLLDNKEIWYIGDSKYYKSDNSIGEYSVYKQITYAKNVIQWNLTSYLNKSNGWLKYRDQLTEGYNITPNFFIRGNIDFDKKLSYETVDLVCETKEFNSPFIQFTNRLFDRDTLFLQTYQINFLFVLAAYAKGFESNVSKQAIRKKISQDYVVMLNKHYDFFKLYTSGITIKEFVNEYFSLLLGKIFCEDNPSFIWLALEKNNPENSTILKQIEDKVQIEQVIIEGHGICHSTSSLFINSN